MAANHQSWHISTLKNSSFKHHIYYSYNSHNTHMIHKSLSTTLNLHKASLSIVIYNIVSFQYYPRIQLTWSCAKQIAKHRKRDNLSQHSSLWRALLLAWRSDYRPLAMASWIARLAKRYGSLAMASWVSRFFTIGCLIILMCYLKMCYLKMCDL